ncbi:MAG TPA: Ig-like domain-containing protein [Vicinamibacterales bacterium]|nr:Ig-like domain-containing protein [Vicinamibacterales bacterium]
MRRTLATLILLALVSSSLIAATAICPSGAGPTANSDTFTVASTATLDASGVVANDIDPDGRLVVAGVDTTGTLGSVHISYAMAVRGGLDGFFYSVPSGATTDLLTDTNGHIPLETMSASACALTTTFNFPSIDTNSFSPFANIGSNNIAAMFVGFVDIPTPGTYTFATTSDDGSALWIDTNLDGVLEEIVNNNFSQGATLRSGTATFATAGAYPIRIGYFQGGGGASLDVQWQRPSDSSLSDIPATSLGTATATITYTPPPQDYGIVGTNPTDTFHYTVRNASGGTSTAAVTVTINGITTTDEDTTLPLVNPSQTAPDGSTLFVSSVDTTGTLGTIATTPIFVSGGLTGRYFDLSSVGGPTTATLTPDVNGNIPLEAMTPAVTALTTTIDFPHIDINSYSPFANVGVSNNAALWSGWIQIPTSGTWTFATTSDDGSALWIDADNDGIYEPAEEIVNNNFFQGATLRSGTVTLTAGMYRIRIAYYQGGGGASMNASWQGPADSSLSTIPASALGAPAVTATYDPTVAFNHLSVGVNGSDHFSYTLASLSGFSITVPAALTITGLNDPPTANADSYATDEDTPLSVAAATGVLANDSDPDSSDVLTVSASSTTSSLGATVAVGADGSFVYDPRGSSTLQALPIGQTTADTFTYTASDSHGGTSSATVTITVTGLNDLPVAVADSGATDEDTLLSVGAPGVLANDHDPDTGDTITVTPFTGASAKGAAVVLNANGSYTYDPRGSATLQALPQGATTTDTFTYTIADNHGATATTTVTITVTGVNDPPVAVDDTAGTNKTTPLNVAAPGVLANDSDVDHDALTVTAFDPTSAKGATVTVASNGAWTYDPTTSATLLALPQASSTTDTFHYTISDGHGGTAIATVTITVTGSNLPPVAAPDSGATDEDTLLSIAAPGVLGNDDDPDAGDTISVTAFQATSAKGAVVTVAPNGAWTYDPRGAATLQALSQGATTTDTFTYTISDNHAATATTTVTVTVTGVNDPPVAGADTASATRDTLLSVAAPGVLGNDVDVDTADALTVAAYDATSARGATVVVNPNGSFTYDPRTSAQLQTLVGGQTATDTFHYTVRDAAGAQSIGTVTVTVNGTSALLVITKSASATSPVTTGATITYQLGVTNQGPGTATNVAVHDPLPAAVDFMSSTCGSLSGTTLVWNIGTMASSASATCSVTVLFQRVTTQIVNTATVSSDVTDPAAATSTATATVPVAGASIPALEPSALLLLFAALAGIGWWTQRR